MQMINQEKYNNYSVTNYLLFWKLQFYLKLRLLKHTSTFRFILLWNIDKCNLIIQALDTLWNKKCF